MNFKATSWNPRAPVYAYGNPEAATAPKKVSLLSLLQLLSPAKAKSAAFFFSK